MALALGAQASEGDPGSSLLSLPLDMQTYLLSFVAPLDILHLRMTCRSFYNIASQQIVWIEALRQICLANAIFLPTFPLDEMTVPELEHAAMAPYKWLALGYVGDGSGTRTSVGTHRIRNLSPVEASLHSDEMDPPEEDDFEVRSLFLVPGGRFLVTFSWRWICVWDLGFATPESSGSPIQNDTDVSEPIAKVKVDLHSMHLVHASPDGQSLRIFVSCPTYANDQKLTDVLHVFEIYPQHEDAELNLIGRLDVVVLKIWNFKTNGWTSWTVQGGFQQAIVTPTLVLLIHSTAVSIWRIPRLMVNAPLFSFVNPTPQPPALNIPYSVSRPPGDDVYSGPSDWYSGTPLPITYDVATITSLDEMHLQRYEIVLTDEPPYATLVETLAAVIPVRDDDDTLNLEPYRFCMDSLVAWWYETYTDTMNIYTGPVRAPQDAAGGSQRVLGVQTTAISAAGTASSFCPMSGRFAYLDDDDDSLQGVVVLDFLLPLGAMRSDNARPAAHPVELDNNLADSGRWMDDLTRWNANLYNPTQF
ncbi:hypothetical protein BDN70DRAFT_932655 [Pholiota conissans]|uniref:F-box domain-containing protein n=1 Tax=Pholiota conissans TaxID=109636 RepID=A0A9P5Z2Z0_9AGAR|nr:hypothetical protein BDN70DRAFT_932655 [Pholiota conissans]